MLSLTLLYTLLYVVLHNIDILFGMQQGPQCMPDHLCGEEVQVTLLCGLPVVIITFMRALWAALEALRHYVISLLVPCRHWESCFQYQ